MKADVYVLTLKNKLLFYVLSNGIKDDWFIIYDVIHVENLMSEHRLPEVLN